MKKRILKDIIIGLLHQKIIKIKDENNSNKLSIDLNNNKNSLQKYNSNNNYIHNIYNYSNKNIINNMMINNMVSNLLLKYFNSKISNKYINKYKNIKYITSQPIYKNSNDKLNIIIFIYNNYNNNLINNKNNNILLIRMIENLNNNTTNNTKNLNKILSKIYNKNVIIEPIILKYDYFNNNIFSKNISNNINIYNTYKKEYSRILNNNITLLDRMSLILNNNKYKNYINNIINNNILLYLTSNNNNNNNKNNINIKEYLNINNTIWNILNNKYLIGYSFKFTGKLPKSLSTARKLTYIKYNGSLKHNTLDNLSIKHTLNNYKSNISISSTNNINKNGKFNVNIKLGHI